MKVTWLDAACTRGLVTRGWLTKRAAIVQRVRERHDIPDDWEYAGDPGVPCPELERWLDSRRRKTLAARRRAERDAMWQPVRALPRARIVK